jgi:hypothetical protein
MTYSLGRSNSLMFYDAAMQDAIHHRRSSLNLCHYVSRKGKEYHNISSYQFLKDLGSWNQLTIQSEDN